MRLLPRLDRDIPLQFPGPRNGGWNERDFHLVAVAILLLFPVANGVQAGPVALTRQVITLPANAGRPLFADVEGNGRRNLLVIDPVGRRLLNYQQRPAGFNNSPDQVVLLPPQTAWVAPCDVDGHPGLELLISTATGLVYVRQNAGLFETERRTLIETNQVITNFDFPILTSLTTNRIGTNTLIPVISAGQTVLYHRNSAYEWSPGPGMNLAVKQTVWSAGHDPQVNGEAWMMGSTPGRRLYVRQSFLARPDPNRDPEPENETSRKILADMKKNADASPPNIDRLDVDGDGREDLVLWQVSGKLDVKTDLYLFLRRPDRTLPEQPTQTLHLRGFPIPIGSTQEWSLMKDLNGDGICELVLLELKSTFTSASGAVETALSHGLDWSLAIRPFSHGGFSRNPAASVPVTSILQSEVVREWSIFIQGDFNGDGRPDLLVKGSGTQWSIFPSTTDGRWYATQPAMTFDAPGRGYLEIDDLNGDGLADIVWHELNEPRLSVFFSPASPVKSRNP